MASNQDGEASWYWGVIGSTVWEVLQMPRSVDGYGPVRTVEQGVGYVLEGADAAKVAIPFARWSKRPDDLYEMDLGGLERPRRTFERVRQEIQSRGRRAGDEQLDDFDAIVGALLGAVGRLHAVGLGIGLLQPKNVVVVPGPDGTPSVILPDFGFVRFRGLLPEWMSKDLPFRALWDKSPEWMNERTFDRIRYPRSARRFADTSDKVEGRGWDPQSDIRTLARLIAWLLAPDGKVRRTIPGRDEASWTRAGVWDVLTDAIEGKFPDVAAFAAALQGDSARPSRHFVEQIENGGPEPPKGRLRWILVAAGLVGVTLGVFLFFRSPQSSGGGKPLQTLCPECQASSPLQAFYQAQYLPAEKDPEREYLALKTMVDKGFTPGPGERECLDRLVDMPLQRLVKRLENLQQEMYEAGADPEAARRKASELEDLFKSLFALRSKGSPPPKEYAPWLD